MSKSKLDNVSKMLKEMPVEDVYTRAACLCNIRVSELQNRYSHLRVSRQREILADLIRKAVKRTQAVFNKW